MSERSGQRLIQTTEQSGERAFDAAERGAERLVERLHQVDDRVRNFVNERPLMAVGAALGVGYLVGKLVSRRR